MMRSIVVSLVLLLGLVVSEDVARGEDLPGDVGSVVSSSTRTATAPSRTEPWVATASEGACYERACTVPLIQQPRKRWEVILAVYQWAPDISGTTYTDGAATDVDISFSDLYDKLESSYMGYVEGRYDRWSLAVDASYVSFEETRTGPVAGTQLALGLDQTLVDVRLGFAVLCRTVGSANWGRCCHPRTLTLDAVVGARYWNLELDADLVTPRGRTRAASSSEDWWDPYVGARFRWQFAKRWGMTLYGDVGGFGIEDSSELTWNLQAHVRYFITRGFFVSAGYRALSVDRATGSGATHNGIDATYHGPILGVGFTF